MVGVGRVAMGNFVGNCTYIKALLAIGKQNYTGSVLLETPTNLAMPIMINRKPNVTIASGDKIQEWVRAHANSSLTIYFDLNQQYGTLPRQGGQSGVISKFSSWGPTFDQGLYPHVAAPGGSVMGAVTNGTYEIESGTSFACPYTAGLIALYLSGHPNATAQEVRTKLITTANMAPNNQVKDSQGFYDIVTDNLNYAPLIQQGNGYIDLVSFYDRKSVILSAPYLNLNDTKNRIADHVITFQNNGNTTVHYQITHKSYQVLFLRNSTGEISKTPLNSASVENIVLISTNGTFLQPGQLASFNVSISAPLGLNLTLAPMFSGAFSITGSNGDLLTVPYIGMEFNSLDWPVFLESKPVTIGNSDTKVIATLNSSVTLTDPVIHNTMVYGTSFLSFDLVDISYNLLSYKYGQEVGKNGFLGPLDIQSQDESSENDKKLPMYNASPYAPVKTLKILGFANGSTIPNGQYKLLSRALKIFGNVNDTSDWSVQLTPAFQLKMDNQTSQNSNQTSQSSNQTSRSKGGAGTFSVSAGLVLLHLLLALF